MLSLIKYLLTVREMLAARANSERGATATEYAVLVALIALVIVTGVTVFGTALDGWFSGIADAIPLGGGGGGDGDGGGGGAE